MPPRSLFDDPGVAKLVRLFGEARTQALVEDVMRENGIAQLETADDRYRLGGGLVRRGGLLESVGRAIRVQAILHGAIGD
jgi:hypothetical protein